MAPRARLRRVRRRRLAGVRNPARVRLKDAYLLQHDDGQWHLGGSEISDAPFRFRLGGLASPSVVRAPDGRYVMTYNRTRVMSARLTLYYRTSTDLVTWTEPTRIRMESAVRTATG